MTAEKYRVSTKALGNLWEGMATTEDEAVACATLARPEVKAKDMIVEIVPFAGETAMTGTKQARKPRADKGQPRTKKTDPPKRVRGKGEYFVCYQVPTVCQNKDDLFITIEKDANPDARPFIIQGRRIQFERKVQYSLKLA